MGQPNTKRNFQGPTVAIFSNRNSLAEKIVKKLSKELCCVVVVTSEKKKWASVNVVNQKSTVHVTSSKDIRPLKFNYIFVISLYNQKKSKRSLVREKRKIETALEISKVNLAKCIIVLPFVQTSHSQKNLSLFTEKILRNNDLVSLVYLGQLVGDKVEEKDNLIAEMLFAVATSKIVKVSIKVKKFFPVNIDDVVNKLVRMLFSYGTPGSSAAIISKGIVSDKFVKKIKKLKPDIEISDDNSIYYLLAKPKQHILVSIKINKELQSLLVNFEKKNIGNFSTRQEKTKKPYWLVFSTAVIVLILPLILLLSSVLGLFLAKELAVKGKFSFADNILNYSSATSRIASAQMRIYGKIPLIGHPFNKLNKVSKLVIRVSGIAKRGLTISTQTVKLFEKIMGNEKFDVSFYSNSIALDLDYLYKETGFLQSDINDLAPITRWLEDGGLKKEKLSLVRQKIYLSKKLIEELPQLLGSDRKTSYLILFQNNMELRPTGGFIGSFAMVNFNKGRLGEIEILDVYSADGQLKGHVKPPLAIKQYLREATWYLRDSNWDPDFPVSAQRAEWFLDKEMDISVDGVLAVDLEFVKKIIRVTGPVYLKDFDMALNSENFYEVIQSEVENSFFPGSRKKANLLSAIASESITNLTSLEKPQYLDVGLSIIESLEERHLQIYLHNPNANKALFEAGWDGAVVDPNCSGNCYFDWLGMIEANLGVNKVNYYIQRSAQLKVVLEDNVVKRELTINLSNQAPSSDGKFPWYKVYFRVLAPIDSKFGPVEFTDGTKSKLMEPDTDEVRGHKEAGVFLEISPGKTGVIKFVWDSDFDIDYDKAGEYGLLWRKQAGVTESPVMITIETPVRLKSKGEGSLTKEGTIRYNSTLPKDNIFRAYW